MCGVGVTGIKGMVLVESGRLSGPGVGTVLLVVGLGVVLESIGVLYPL